MADAVAHIVRVLTDRATHKLALAPPSEESLKS